MKKTSQEDFWSGEFGNEYADRNEMDHAKWNEFYVSRYGVSKTDLNIEFLEGIPKTSTILEVGCNTGMQLAGFDKLGYKNLSGIDINPYALEKAKQKLPAAKFSVGSALELPFADKSFDVVCVHGVLIHIHPKDVPAAIKELGRVCKKRILVMEYFSEETKEIKYRGNTEKLWKANFPKLFAELLPEFKITKSKLLPYINEEEKGNVDVIFCLDQIN
jgi:pseudaminic acid biosynthesis-associated methylase